MNPRHEHTSAIEDHLDELLVTAAGRPRAVRHLLIEAEGHLRETAAALAASGVPVAEAEAEAVARFGPTGAASRAPLWCWLTPGMRRRITLGVLAVGGVAGAFVGVAGALGAVVRAIWGAGAIATPFPSGSYTAADCSRWMRLAPSAKDCVSAMTIDHANDFVAMCLLAGVLGLVALGIRAMLQHRWNSRAVRWALPPAAEYVAGSVAAVLAAVGTSAMGLDSILVTHGQGVGQPFVFAAAASLAAIALGALARRAARPQPWRVAD